MWSLMGRLGEGWLFGQNFRRFTLLRRKRGWEVEQEKESAKQPKKHMSYAIKSLLLTHLRHAIKQLYRSLYKWYTPWTLKPPLLDSISANMARFEWMLMLTLAAQIEFDLVSVFGFGSNLLTIQIYYGCLMADTAGECVCQIGLAGNVYTDSMCNVFVGVRQFVYLFLRSARCG